MPKAPPDVAPIGVEVDGNALRELRKSRGLTISDLAPQVPMSIGFLSQLERGRRKRLSPPKFIRLVAALGIQHAPEKIRPRQRRKAA